MTIAADYKTAESQVLAEIVAQLDKIGDDYGPRVKPVGLHTTPAAVAEKVATTLAIRTLVGKATIFDHIAGGLAVMAADDLDASKPENLTALKEAAILTATLAVIAAARLKNGESK